MVKKYTLKPFKKADKPYPKIRKFLGKKGQLTEKEKVYKEGRY